MTTAVIDQINLVTSDFDATLDFYRGLGIDLADPHRTNAGEPFHAAGRSEKGAILEADSAAFAKMWNAGWAGEAELAGRAVIGIRVADRDTVDRLYAEATAKGQRGLQPPIDAFWGARYAIVEDPNGIAVGLMSPADDRFRSSPPSF